jgi:DNA-binding transcriptional ArsR family regulator
MLFPDAFAAALSDRTTALAAAFIIGARHADVLQFVARIIGGADAEPEVEPPARRRAARRSRKANGHRQPRVNGGDSRLPARDEADKRLVEAMRRNTEATIGELATAVGKSRTSIVSALHRLRDAGLAKSVGGRWALVKQEEPREPAPKWIEPLSAAREHRAHV